MIVHVITNFSGIGGAEIMLSRLVKETVRDNTHVIISLMEISDVYVETLEHCHSYYSLKWNGFNTLLVIAKLRKLLRQLAPETIQCWMYHANALTSLSIIGLKQKPKVVWGIHHSLASPKDESISTKIALGLSKVLSKQPDAIVYCAYSSKQQHSDFGFRNANQQVIVNGVFLNKFQPNNALHQPTVIGFAGRYHKAKGYPYLFKAMGLLKNKNIIFKIAGGGASLDNPEVKALFERYQLDHKKVQLLDQISEMPAFYQSIDAFLMTSITEGFPNVLVEAMASGLPCISTDVGDAKYIVQDLGAIVPPRNAQALADAILAYVAKSNAEKIALKQATRQRIEQNFCIEKISEQYKAVWSI
ncbi:glycosyltransferase [Acinetobacter towneri]|uniref:Glycosyltransferase n=1 Tax=Acinetobacter towneri TaxID=202956 RepID=A0AB35M2H2_9GAMM|nr:glycosyltransferase [Acinetobacter towneri]MDM1719806.1 glycosyltransferase [Acinetobacter towneri]MDM1731887.1 glycosyltransferase [Acinetobacter towneri]MDM1734563.1 glycosyltransferase [Acinetobacter towneri]MDM1739873.1 glycosyltransferase [Acinetobacter towneri]MDM1742539.1 glycosyltransferase [Acinetobacter towneri]